MRRSISLMLMLVLFVALNSVSANYLTNASFEDPNVAPGDPGYLQLTVAGGGPTGWVLLPEGTNDFIELINAGSTVLWGGVTTTAADGERFVQLNEDSHLIQELVLSPGIHILSVSYTGQVGQAGEEGATIGTHSIVAGNVVNLSLNKLSYSGANTAANPDWQYAEYQLVVPDGATSTVIEFYGRNGGVVGGEEFMWIDKVNLFGGPCGAVAGDVSGPDDVPDCRVDLYDFAALAANWFFCYDPVESHCP